MAVGGRKVAARRFILYVLRDAGVTLVLSR
jgi:hypothetical protein